MGGRRRAPAWLSTGWRRRQRHTWCRSAGGAQHTRPAAAAHAAANAYPARQTATGRQTAPGGRSDHCDAAEACPQRRKPRLPAWSAATGSRQAPETAGCRQRERAPGRRDAAITTEQTWTQRRRTWQRSRRDADSAPGAPPTAPTPPQNRPEPRSRHIPEPNGSFAAPPSTPHRPEASVEQHRTTIRRPRGLWRRMGDDRSHEMRAAGASDPSARSAAAASGPAGGRTQSRTDAAESLAAPLDPTRRMAPAAPPLHGLSHACPQRIPTRPPRPPAPNRSTGPGAPLQGSSAPEERHQPADQGRPAGRFYECQPYVTSGIGLVHVCVIWLRSYECQPYVTSGIGLVHVCVIWLRSYECQPYVTSGIGLVHVCVIREILRRGPPEGRAPPWAGPKTPVVCSQVMVGKRQVCARPTRALCQTKV